MKKDNIDKVIKDTYTEFDKEIDMHFNIDIPDFNITIKKFHKNLKEKSSRSSILKKLALVASFTLVIIFSTLLSSIPTVTAFKFNIIKIFEELRGSTKDIKFSTNGGLDNNSNNRSDQIEKIVTIDEAKKEAPFKLLVPRIPEDYTLKSVIIVKAMGDYFSVNQTYTNSMGKIIQINQSTVSEREEETISISSELKTEDIVINNLKIKSITDNKNFKKIIWFDNNIKNEALMPYNIANTQMKQIIGILK